MDNKEERIRQRAYAIWVAEGYPEGCEEQHWQQAHDEISAASVDDSDTMTDDTRPTDDAQRAKSPKRIPQGTKA